MLILTRKLGESVVINNSTYVTVMQQKENQVMLGFMAPRDVIILRQELYLKMQAKAKNDVQLRDCIIDNLFPLTATVHVG